MVSGSGVGPPLILLHGFTGSAEAWGDALLERLAATHRRVVAVDLIGHGKSARSADPERYRLHEVVGDVARVQEELVGEPAIWIGYSMGARIALAAAALGLAPQRGLVIESGSPGLPDQVQRGDRVTADEMRAAQLEREGIEPFVDRWLAQPLFSTQRALPPDVRARERARRLAQDPVSLAACLRGLGLGRQPSVWHRLSSIDVPALFLAGALDRKFADLARLMSARVPNVHHVEVPGAGHAVHLERADAWVEAVTTWSAQL